MGAVYCPCVVSAGESGAPGTGLAGRSLFIPSPASPRQQVLLQCGGQGSAASVFHLLSALSAEEFFRPPSHAFFLRVWGEGFVLCSLFPLGMVW